MNRHFLCTLVGLGIACSAFAQQLPLLSQFQESAGVLNPAAVGSTYLFYGQDLRIGATHHSQWGDIEGSPRTSQLVAEAFYDDYGPVAPLAGLYFVNDQTGPSGLTGLYAKIGGVLSDDPASYGIAAALQVGVNQYRLRISELELRDNETILAADDDGRVYPDAGLGVFAYTSFGRSNYVYGGLSAPQLLGLDLMFRGNEGDIVTQRYRHYYAQAGAIFGLTKQSFLEPSVWVKYVPDLPVNVSATLLYQTETALFLGVGGTSAKAIHGELGLVLGDREGYGTQFRVGYGFDYAFTSFGPYAGATHEINLTYSLDR